jgi:Terminase large subunit, ATPase domain
VIGIADYLGPVQSEGPNRRAGSLSSSALNRNQNAKTEPAVFPSFRSGLWYWNRSKASAVLQVALEEGEVVRPADHLAAFCATLTQSDDRWEGQPLQLEPWQRRFWRDALADDWRSVVLVVPRKNGKTSMLAAYALYELVYGMGRPEILLAAASDRQAGRLFDAAARFVRRHPGLSERLRVGDHEGVIVREDGLGSIIRLTSDPSRRYGYSPTLVVCDELAFWNTPSLRRAYAALTSAGGARSAPCTFTITTAGEATQRHDSLLGSILDAALSAPDVQRRPGLTISRLHAAGTLLWAYEAPTADPRDVRALKLANPASWITLDYLRRQAENPELTDAQVLQLHGCVWAEASETLLTGGAAQAGIGRHQPGRPYGLSPAKRHVP